MADKTGAPEDKELEDLGEQADTPWDEDTAPFIDEIEDTVSTKYGISFKTLLSDPEEYAEKPGILDILDKVKGDVDAYFDNLVQELQPEEEELNKVLEGLDALYTKLDQAISSKASIAKVPYLKPLDVDFEDSNPETISIDEYNNNVDTLISKFVNISNYIANLSTTYKKYNVGSWLFSGERDYVLSVSQPESMVITVESAQDYVKGALDETTDLLSTAASAK